MKKFLLFIAVTALTVLSSCSSDSDSVKEDDTKVSTFTATMEGATRATIDDETQCPSWDGGEQIVVNGQTYIAQNAGASTTFKARDEAASGPVFKAYFACYSDGKLTTLPAVYIGQWEENKYYIPMFATTKGTNLEFKSLCGALKISIANGQIASVKSIRLSSTNHALSGEFTVNGNNVAVLVSPSDVANTLTRKYDRAVVLDAKGKDFYIPIPVQAYKNLKIELDADGSGFTKSMTMSSGDFIVERNKIYPITFADNTK